jgi:EAL domain-containing protein (putative c-di-GMP-specific phosphodiesterase class I)
MVEGRLFLVGQPILGLPEDRVVQMELLVRLRDEHGRTALPARFLPLAESEGLVCELDRWVLERACRLAAAGRRVQMNVSAKTMCDRGFVDAAEDALARHGTPPQALTFEITETALITDLHQAQVFAERLSALGCAFALDDFGTGFAPLTYLKRLPIAYLKVDIEFVRDVIIDSRSQALVGAVVHIAQALGLRTIAEGVEDEATLRFLRRLGVDYAQGHHIGRPVELMDECLGVRG